MNSTVPALDARALSIEAAAQAAPNALGLRICGGGAYTFATLAALVRSFLRARARFCEARGLDPVDTPFYVVARRDLSTVIAVYAAFESGTPCILLHPRGTRDERAGQLALCQAALAGGDEGGTGSVQTVAASGAGSGENGHSSVIAPTLCGPRMVLFTSGSTGHGKGVVLPHAAFAASAAASAANLGWRESDRWLCCLPLSHVGGLSIVTRCLAARRMLILEPAAVFRPARVAACLERKRVSLLSLVPTMLTRMLDDGWQPTPHLRAVLLGGAPATPALLERADRAGVPVLTTYGMTETCAQICTQPADSSAALDGRIGLPLPGVKLRIANGRVLVHSPTLFEGYLGAPTPIDEHGWFDTGDSGELADDGALRVFGRDDDTINTGGENVHPGEIEPVVAAHPQVSSACAFGVPDETWGQIVAVAVVSRGSVAPAEIADSLAEFLQPRLAPHKRPRRLAVLSALPIGESGKVHRPSVLRDAPRHLIELRYS